jgi:hypothetical protein
MSWPHCRICVAKNVYPLNWRIEWCRLVPNDIVLFLIDQLVLDQAKIKNIRQETLKETGMSALGRCWKLDSPAGTIQIGAAGRSFARRHTNAGGYSPPRIGPKELPHLRPPIGSGEWLLDRSGPANTALSGWARSRSRHQTVLQRGKRA